MDLIMHTGVPYTKARRASKQAAEPALVGVGRAQLQIWRHVRRKLEHGATCDEVQAALGLGRKNASARIAELSALGRLVDSGERRTTRAAREAIVWRATDPREGDHEQMRLFVGEDD